MYDRFLIFVKSEVINMSGHSHWASIKHKKGKADAEKGKVFSRIGKQITIAARSGGDISMNAALRVAVDAAREVNMPQDNITRAIKKGTGNFLVLFWNNVLMKHMVLVEWLLS